MRYGIAICDDSEADREYLSDLVSRWAREAGHTAEIAAFDSAEQFLFCYEEKSDYDILLLDIEMGEMDGVTMVKILRRENDTVQIVFITGYSEYIAEGYEVAALHYLMKPVREDRLFSVLDRAAEKLKKNEKVLNVECRGGAGQGSRASDPVCGSVRQLRDHPRRGGADRKNDPGEAGEGTGRPVFPRGPFGHRQSDADQPRHQDGNPAERRDGDPPAQRRLRGRQPGDYRDEVRMK